MFYKKLLDCGVQPICHCH